MNDEALGDAVWPPVADYVAQRRDEEERLYLLDIIRALKANPAGMRRWSVMRSIREYRKAAGLRIDQRMEDAVERVFRNHSAGADKSKQRVVAPESALFHWPQGRQGGVWAVYPDKAEQWLKTEGLEV